jgi:hypothetical protein
VLPRVGALKKGICVSQSQCSKKDWFPSLFFMKDVGETHCGIVNARIMWERC